MVTENVEPNEMEKVNTVGAFALLGAIFEDSDLGPCDMDHLSQTINEVLQTLKDRERVILEFRYGVRDGRYRSLKDVGEKFHVTRERIRQIEAKALRKLRHPSRSRMLLSAFFLGSLKKAKESVSELVKEIEKMIAEKKRMEIEGSLLLQRLNELGDPRGMLIIDLDLPGYVLRALRRAGFKYALELLDEERISSVYGIGTIACWKIQDQLKEHNLIQDTRDCV